MKRLIRIISLICLSALFCLQGNGQWKDSTAAHRVHTLGGLLGWGASISPRTGYQTYFFILDYSRSFLVPKKKDFISWYCEPQFNLVRADSTPANRLDYEIGVNTGIRNYIRLNRGIFFYQMLGSGPHFITAHVGRQARGFIFSDNFALGVMLPLRSSHYIGLQYVQRHISNANLKAPNGGVNSCNITIGFFRMW